MAETTSLRDIDERIYNIRKDIHEYIVIGSNINQNTIEYYKALSAEMLALATLRLSYTT